jgi:hypothetical protein
LGFAVRLRQNGGATHFDCEYSGYFSSGKIVGPLKNGTPCRSTLKNDPLEGVQVHFIRRDAADAAPVKPREPAVIGPRFSKLREETPELDLTGTAGAAPIPPRIKSSSNPTKSRTAVMDKVPVAAAPVASAATDAEMPEPPRLKSPRTVRPIKTTGKPSAAERTRSALGAGRK